jgi:hypothetical protein
VYSLNGPFYPANSHHKGRPIFHPATCTIALESRDTEGKVDNIMFKHAQLETVKAWISDPANGSLPLHERIQRAIRTLILEGTLSHGKALPASRALATSLNVSRDTVEAAYSSLHAEGFIERQTGRGASSLPAPGF